MDTVRTIEGDTVDMIVWRERRQTIGVTEQILDLNPGLADRGAILPAGLLVDLPDPPTATPDRVVPRIWS